MFIRASLALVLPLAFVGCDGCSFIQNTIIEPHTWVARILQESTDARFVPSRNGVFVNNVIVFNTADLRTFVNVGGGTAPETFTFGSNLWYAMDDPGFTGPMLTDGIPAETGSVIQMDPGIGTDGHYCNQFTGRALTDATADYDGTCWDDPPTLGAYVWVSCTL